MKKNAFLTFCCAVFPGCGQMYQGYMRRGVSLLAWFFAVITLSTLTNVYVLNLMLPVIWAYSFFDTFNIRSLSDAQRVAFVDDFIPSGTWLRQNKMDGFLRGGRAGKIFGWACIVIGALILYQNFFQNTYYFFRERYPFIGYWVSSLPALIVAAAVIILGIWMLRSKKKPPAEEDDATFGGDDHA